LDEAALLVGAASISVCETMARHRLIEGAPCLCAARPQPMAVERHVGRR
jgi:hypothetical protein